MMTEQIAFELSRQRLAETVTRANLAGSLGGPPQAQWPFPFRRRVISLPGIVEIRRNSDKERIRRRLLELSEVTAVRRQRRAS